MSEHVDPGTQQMCDETGHDCPLDPTDIRNLMACATNLVQVIEGEQWGRLAKKTHALRRAIDTLTPIRDEHFEALSAWRRPS